MYRVSPWLDLLSKGRKKQINKEAALIKISHFDTFIRNMEDIFRTCQGLKRSWLLNSWMINKASARPTEA